MRLDIEDNSIRTNVASSSQQQCSNLREREEQFNPFLKPKMPLSVSCINFVSTKEGFEVLLLIFLVFHQNLELSLDM